MYRNEMEGGLVGWTVIQKNGIEVGPAGQDVMYRNEMEVGLVKWTVLEDWSSSMDQFR